MDRINPQYVLAVTYAAAGVFIALIGSVDGTAVARWRSLVFAAGFCISGSQTGGQRACSELLSDRSSRNRRKLGQRHRAHRLGFGIDGRWMQMPLVSTGIFRPYSPSPPSSAPRCRFLPVCAGEIPTPRWLQPVRRLGVRLH